MANLQVIGIDGISPIYLWAEGTGTALDPYKSNFYAYQGGAWDVSVSNFPSFTGLTNTELRLSPLEVTGTFWQDVQPVILTAGTNAIGSIINTGFDVNNFPDTFPVTQSGTWNIEAITTLPNVTLASESGYLTHRNTALSSTPDTVKTTAGSVMGWNFINPNTAPVYVKFYDTASVILGSTTPVDTLPVPPGDGQTPGMFVLEPSLIPYETFTTAISIVCVTGLADNSTTAPSIPIYAKVRYK